MRKRINYHYFDKTLLLLPVLIFVIGILSIHSASFRSEQPLDQMFTVRQSAWMGVGLLVVFLLIRVDYFKWMDWVWPFYFFSLALLLLVLFMPSRLGAHRWIGAGAFNMQPSELAKLAVILALSHFFAAHKPEYMPKSRYLIPLAVIGVPFVLILREPDLGTALTLVPVFLSMFYFWGAKPKYLVGLLVLMLAVSPLLFVLLKDYQKARLLVFVNPNMDPLGAGYHIIQSKIGIGSGGLLGKGFMSGTQNRLNFIPERHTDFIFSVIGEEGGFLACSVVLLLFGVLIWKGYKISSGTHDRFGSLLACGISTVLAVQTFVNIGMAMGILPVVGMPLPLMSYGGSSVFMTMVSIGILLNIKLYRPLF